MDWIKSAAKHSEGQGWVGRSSQPGTTILRHTVQIDLTTGR
jgi:hypothetical protein